MTDLYQVPLTMIDGRTTTLGEFEGHPILLVNVASQCALTHQYEGLQRLALEFAPQGLIVLGTPCNQFKGQEPGTNEEIVSFCSSTYGVTFPLTEKLDVNGADRHPLFAILTSIPGVDGYQGDVRWNFEKWVISGRGEVLARFVSETEPDDPALHSAIQAALNDSTGD